MPREPRCESTRIRARPIVSLEAPRPHVTDAQPPPRDGHPSPPRSSDFELHVDTSAQHITLLTAYGPLDAESEGHLTTAARLALASAYVLVLDLRPLTRCDAAGVYAVLEVDALARAVDALLVVRPGEDAVHRAFEESGAVGRLRFIGADDAGPAPSG